MKYFVERVTIDEERNVVTDVVFSGSKQECRCWLAGAHCTAEAVIYYNLLDGTLTNRVMNGDYIERYEIIKN